MKKNAIILVNTDFEHENKRKFYSCDNRYIDCLILAGAVPLLVPCTADETLLARSLEFADGVLFIGGRDYPPDFYGGKSCPELQVLASSRSSSDIFLANSALKSGVPVLGICGGAQLLSIASGGKLICHIENSEAHTGNLAHKVRIEDGTFLKEILGGRQAIEIVSSHHQAVFPEMPGRNLRISAWAEDGTPEAVETTEKNRFLLGLQWHPERSVDKTYTMKIFNAFIEAALKYAGR